MKLAVIFRFNGSFSVLAILAQALCLSQVACPAWRCSLGLCASRSFFSACNAAICVAPTGVSEQWARQKAAEPLPVALQGAAGTATCPSSLQVHTGARGLSRTYSSGQLQQ